MRRRKKKYLAQRKSSERRIVLTQITFCNKVSHDPRSLRIDENGKCREMFVMGRPYMPISVFTGRVAMAFARQTGGVPRRVLSNVLVWPLELTQRATEPVRAWLMGGAIQRQLERARRSG